MIKHTLISLGTSKRSDYRNPSEIESLLTLQRGVFQMMILKRLL